MLFGRRICSKHETSTFCCKVPSYYTTTREPSHYTTTERWESTNSSESYEGYETNGCLSLDDSCTGIGDENAMSSMHYIQTLDISSCTINERLTITGITPYFVYLNNVSVNVTLTAHLFLPDSPDILYTSDTDTTVSRTTIHVLDPLLNEQQFGVPLTGFNLTVGCNATVGVYVSLGEWCCTNNWIPNNDLALKPAYCNGSFGDNTFFVYDNRNTHWWGGSLVSVLSNTVYAQYTSRQWNIDFNYSTKIGCSSTLSSVSTLNMLF